MSNRSSRHRGCLADADAFSRWRGAIDRVLETFIARYAPQMTGRLDFSPDSLAFLEAWLLCHTGGAIRTDPDEFLRQRLAIYVGEVFRRNLGGEWTVAFNAVDPHLRGLPLVNCPPACCPLLLIDELLRKRNGFTLHASFEYFRKRRLRTPPPSSVMLPPRKVPPGAAPPGAAMESTP